MITTLFASFYDRAVLRHPGRILLLLAVILAAFAWHTQDFKLDASPDSLLLDTDEDLRVFRELNERYETRDFLFVTYTPTADLFSETSLAQIKRLRTELRALPGVESVTSILDVPLVKIVGGTLSDVAKNYQTLENEGVDIQAAREELLQSPLFRELVVSADGDTTALQIFIEDNPRYRELQKQRNRLLSQRDAYGLSAAEETRLAEILIEYDVVKIAADQRSHELIAAIRSIMDNYRESGQLYLGGVTMIADDMITYIKNDLVVFGTGVFVFLIVMLTTIFRRVRWVCLPLASCFYAGLLMIGLLGWVGWRVTVISSNFISLMLIITMSMNVHLIVRYRRLSQDNPEWDQRTLVATAMSRMVWPCLYTALTTIMAFASLVVSGIKPVIDFGWMMTIGLSVTFLTSFLLFPSLLMLLQRGNEPVRGEGRTQFTARLATLTAVHGNKILALALLLAAAGGVGITKLEVENSFVSYFSDSTEIYQGLKLIDDKLGGTTSLDVVLKFDPEPADDPDSMFEDEGDEGDDFDELFGDIESDKSDTWFTVEKLDRIEAAHDYLDGLAPVGKVLSLTSVLRVAQELNRGEEFDAFQLAIVYKRLPDELREILIDPYISIDHDEARINLRVRDSMKDLRRKELLEQIERDLVARVDIEPDNLEISGLLVLYNNMLQSLFRSQILTLGAVMLGIAVMLLILFRSVSLAVIGIIPNILAAALILGLMGWARIPLDMMTITIAAITIGIAVDNSIHYIYRFREELPAHVDYVETMHYCHANIGRAVFYTATTIIVGFSILVLSNFIPTIYFGLLTALAMAVALLAALTLLPKLILLWKPF